MLEALSRLGAQARELWGKVPAAVKWSLLGLVIFVLLYAALLGNPLKPTPAPAALVALPGQPFAPRDANAVVAKLNELQVPFKLGGADGGTILVAPEQVVRARMAVAQAGVPQQPAGLELFDRSNLTQTDFDRKVQLLRAQKGELERAILQLAWVRTAVVNLSIPEKSVFIREQKPVKAAVMVEARPGVEVNGREVEGIVRFVAASVPELDQENVIVIDNTGRTLAQGLKPPGGPQPVTEASDHLKQQLAYQKSLETTLQAMLDRAFGPGNASAMVSVKLSYDSQQQEETRYEGTGPNSQGLLRSEQTIQKSFEGQGAPAAAGAPAQGADANAPNPPVYQTGPSQAAGPSSYDERTRTANYELNQIKTVRVTPPGRVESVSVGVLLNNKILQTASPAEIAQIQAAVAHAIGAPVAAVTVAPLPFRNDLLESFRPREAQPGAAAGAAAVDWQRVAVGTGILAGLLLLVMAAMAWRRRQPPALAPVPALAGTAAMDLEELVAARAEGTSAPLPAAAAAAESLAEADALADVDLTQLLGEEFRAKPDPVRQKLREEIERMARQHPEAVAQLIRAWISENGKQGER